MCFKRELGRGSFGLEKRLGGEPKRLAGGVGERLFQASEESGRLLVEEWSLDWPRHTRVASLRL